MMKQPQQQLHHPSSPPEIAISKPPKPPPNAEQTKDMKEADEEEWAAKKVAKRKRAKQRQKERQQQELKQQTTQELQTAVKSKKTTNKVTVVCGTCDKGFTGCGFKCYDRKFCSPKCARAAEPPNILFDFFHHEYFLTGSNARVRKGGATICFGNLQHTPWKSRDKSKSVMIGRHNRDAKGKRILQGSHSHVKATFARGTIPTNLDRTHI
eukprot:scaffold274340_cov23-Attheya_sp.AAC.1